jgi:cobyric acid synthase
LASKSRNLESGKINIAVILVPHLSNFTDFNALEQDSRVHLFYTDDAEDIEKADIIVLPGSKSTIADLCELRKKGLAEAIKDSGIKREEFQLKTGIFGAEPWTENMRTSISWQRD